MPKFENRAYEVPHLALAPQNEVPLCRFLPGCLELSRDDETMRICLETKKRLRVVGASLKLQFL